MLLSELFSTNGFVDAANSLSARPEEAQSAVSKAVLLVAGRIPAENR
jgi:hypothetical protein